MDWMPFPAPFPAFVPGSLLGLWVLQGWLTRSRLRELSPLPPPLEGDDLPSICICIPARDEAGEIGSALDSWLGQDYPALSVLVADDGSTDGTADLLAERAARRPDRLRVLRVDELPAGWLGKNHALHLAASQPEARAAEWLLFVDADVRATPDLLRRAVAHLRHRPADLLTLIAAVDAVSAAERIFIPIALTQFLWISPPKRVADPHSAFFCGTGGFSLVRRKAYDAVGGHAAAPLESIDDMRLAQRMKREGFLNGVARGGPDLRLRMYHGLPEIIRAMRKNVLGIAHMWIFAPLLILLLLAAYSTPLWLALGGWPLTGLALWALWPAMVAEAYQRIAGRPADWIWILWPLAGLIASVGIARALVDRLRGVNHWRAREIPIRPAVRPRTS